MTYAHSKLVSAKYLRIMIYAWFSGKQLIDTISRISKGERKLISESNLIQTKQIKVKITSSNIDRLAQSYLIDFASGIEMELNIGGAYSSSTFKINQLIKGFPQKFENQLQITYASYPIELIREIQIEQRTMKRLQFVGYKSIKIDETLLQQISSTETLSFIDTKIEQITGLSDEEQQRVQKKLILRNSIVLAPQIFSKNLRAIEIYDSKLPLFKQSETEKDPYLSRLPKVLDTVKITQDMNEESCLENSKLAQLLKHFKYCAQLFITLNRPEVEHFNQLKESIPESQYLKLDIKNFQHLDIPQLILLAEKTKVFEIVYTEIKFYISQTILFTSFQDCGYQISIMTRNGEEIMQAMKVKKRKPLSIKMNELPVNKSHTCLFQQP